MYTARIIIRPFDGESYPKRSSPCPLTALCAVSPRRPLFVALHPARHRSSPWIPSLSLSLPLEPPGEERRRGSAKDGSIDYPARERVSLSFVLRPLRLRLVVANFRCRVVSSLAIAFRSQKIRTIIKIRLVN